MSQPPPPRSLTKTFLAGDAGEGGCGTGHDDVALVAVDDVGLAKRGDGAEGEWVRREAAHVDGIAEDADVQIAYFLRAVLVAETDERGGGAVGHVAG